MGSLDDFHNQGKRLRRELEQIEFHHEADRELVKRYVRKKDPETSESTLYQYLKNLRKTRERIDTPLVELSEADLEAHVYDLRHGDYGRDGSGMSDNTVRNIEFAVTDFLDRMTDKDWPDEYDITTQPDNKVSPEDMLEAEDIKALREGASNLRDIALIEFLADTGCRMTLAGSLRVRDVEFDSEGATYRPNREALGLKGAEIMDYPIIDAKASMRSYIRNIHPRPDDPDIAFFHKLPGHGNTFEDDDGSLSPTTIRRQIRRAADNGGVDKPVNPHNFRHSAITRMRREGYDRSQIEHRVQWTVDTDMWATYEHISAEQHNQAIFAQAGVTDGEDSQETVRVRCGNCTEVIAPHHEFCPKCGAAASPNARELEQQGMSDVASAMAGIDDMSRREFYAHVMGQLGEDSTVLEGHEDPPESA